MKEGLLAQTPQLVIGGGAIEAVVNAPDDDGVSAHLGPQLRYARQAQEPLRLAKRAAHAQGKHDGMVPAGAALAGKDVVDNGAVKTGGAYDLGALHALLVQKLSQVVGEVAIEGGVRLAKVGLHVGRCQEAGEKILCQAFPAGHAIPSVFATGWQAAAEAIVRLLGRPRLKTAA